MLPHHRRRRCLPAVLCRPLVLGRRQGRRGEEWCVASEDCAFGPIGFERVRDVQPGEMILIDDQGRLTSRQVAQVRGGWLLVLVPLRRRQPFAACPCAPNPLLLLHTRSLFSAPTPTRSPSFASPTCSLRARPSTYLPTVRGPHALHL